MDALRLSCRCFEIFLYVRLHTHVLTTVACIPCDITVSYLYHIHFAALDELHPALSKRLQPQCSRLRPCIPRVRPDFRSRAHAGLQHRCVSKPYTCIEKLGTVLFVHSEFAMLNLPTVIILCISSSFPLPFLLVCCCFWVFGFSFLFQFYSSIIGVHRRDAEQASPFCEVLGRNQRQWLRRSLQSSRAAVKLVLSGSVLLHDPRPFDCISGEPWM